MLRFSTQQVHSRLLADRPALVEDVIEHLQAFCPHVVDAYPPGYLRDVVNSSIDLAFGLGVDDVYSVRLFTRLRWDIAPGFFLEPTLNAVLSQHDRPAQARFEQLATPAYDDAWLEAMQFDGPQYWRGAPSGNGAETAS